MYFFNLQAYIGSISETEKELKYTFSVDSIS